MTDWMCLNSGPVVVVDQDDVQSSLGFTMWTISTPPSFLPAGIITLSSVRFIIRTAAIDTSRSINTRAAYVAYVGVPEAHQRTTDACSYLGVVSCLKKAVTPF